MGFFERMKKYNYNDVIEIYASCGHMCYTFSYNFDLIKAAINGCSAVIAR